MKNILEQPITKQAKIIEQGEDQIADRFFRGIRSKIRKDINENAFKPWRIDLTTLNKNMSEAMAVAFLVSSGQIDPRDTNNDKLDYSQPFLDSVGFRFDLPFAKALELWNKHNPFYNSIVNRVLDKGKTYTDNFTSRLTLQIQENVSKALESGLPATTVMQDLRNIGDRGSSVYEQTMKDGIATAQNAGMKMRLESSSNIAIWEYRGPTDDRTTGAPNGLYAKERGGKNPGHCWEMSGFKAVPSHPIWNTIYPLNHYGCRFRIAGLTWVMARMKGYLKQDGTVKEKYKNPTIPKFILDGSWPEKGFQVAPDVMLGVNA